MQPRSELLLPPVSLAGCLFGAFVRDTRGCRLPDDDRFNHFAASPLCCISWFFEGDCHLLDAPQDMANPGAAPRIAACTVSGPQQTPRTSWNPGDVHAMILAFYPEAFAKLTGLNPGDWINKTVPVQSAFEGPLLRLAETVRDCGDSTAGFELVVKELSEYWPVVRSDGSNFGQRVADWCSSLAVRAHLSAIGRSTRQAERRIKSWTGQSLRSLGIHAKIDRAYGEALTAKAQGNLDLAQISAEAGYADQSHMSRQVRSQTGYPPGELMKRIETEEAFWSFRLLGERY